MAARSTTTDPGFMLSIMYFLISNGARFPAENQDCQISLRGKATKI
jgi:hypothetical protein